MFSWFTSTPPATVEELIDYDHIPLPPGKRVRSTSVIDHNGVDVVRVELEDIPVSAPATLSYALVRRE